MKKTFLTIIAATALTTIISACGTTLSSINNTLYDINSVATTVGAIAGTNNNNDYYSVQQA